MKRCKIIFAASILVGSLVLPSRLNVTATATTYEKDSLDVWIERLILVESGGRADIKILDTNNKYSYGCLQFQEETWKYQMQKFSLRPYAESQELMNEIYDCSLQKTLAKEMILGDYGNWRHWLNSSNVIGLPPG